MRILLPLHVLFAVCTLGNSFILIPDEVISLLNVLYSRLPPVSAGVNNTKVGLGFRIGRTVDLQVLFELGPQYSTTPGPTDSSKREINNNSNNKNDKHHRFRDVRNRRPNSTLINRLWGRRPAIMAPTTMDVRLIGDDKENEIEHGNNYR